MTEPALWTLGKEKADLQIEVDKLKALLRQKDEALTCAYGALIEVSPCAHSECQQVQRETVDWAIKKIEAVKAALAADAKPEQGNYVADDETFPKRIEFADGRIVTMVGEGYLQVGRK